MNEQEFALLLSEPESDTLDFKQSHYDFAAGDDGEHTRKRGAFVKDILAMKNTPRERSAYIVLGVKCQADGTKELCGLPHQIDDAEFQDKVNGLVYPHPKFRYSPVLYNGLSFGVIEIPPDRAVGPCLPLKDIPGAGLKQKWVYVRRNSRNSEADYEEQSAVYAWFDDSPDVRLEPRGEDPAWDNLVRSTHGFESGRRFMLAVSPVIPGSEDTFVDLAWVDWQFVADFDPESQITGALKACRSSLETRRGVHVITKADRLVSNSARATYWYFARGLSGRDSSMQTGRFKEWLAAYGNDLNQRVREASALATEPVTVIALWNDPSLASHLRRFFQAVTEALGDRVEFVIVSADATPYANLADESEATLIEMSSEHFLAGLRLLKQEQDGSIQNEILIPAQTGQDVAVSPDDFAWLEEELEIVHRFAGASTSNQLGLVRDFLRGRSISWFELGLQADVQRERTSKLERVIDDDLRRRRTIRINLYHQPGAGGSTVARRILWDRHRSSPCVILRQCSARATVERIDKIFKLTGKPVLILREGSNVSDGQADELFELLASRNIPAVLFQVLRRYELGFERERGFNLESRLTTLEGAWFGAALTREVPLRKGYIENALRPGNSDTQTPFFLGLVAFQEEFTGITSYVENHLRDLSQEVLEVLVYLSLAYYYGQQSLPEQLFADVLHLPPSELINLRKSLPGQALGLIVEGRKGSWRPAHQLIAREVIQQVLGSGLADIRTWNTRLADWADQFANFCLSAFPLQTREIKDVVERVFYYRDDAELLGTVKSGERLFSKLIADVPVAEARLRILQRLVHLFPEEAHFWAHLGRFYSIEMRDFDKAIEAIDQAIALEPKDHVLYHMKGMAYRGLARRKMSENAGLADLLPLGKLASECFHQARNLELDDDHAYISDAQLIIETLDYARQKSESRNAVQVAALHSDPWLRESFQTAEDLLLSVRTRRKNEKPSEYEIRCRANLDSLYGQHERALQLWQGLLERRGTQAVHAPPIRRQIVWTYLARNERRWDKMRPQELERSIQLLEQNANDEPNDDRNIRLWLQASRYLSKPPEIDRVIERVAYWKTLGNSLDAGYYLYVLYSLQVMNGSAVAIEKAERALEECRVHARYRRDRTRSFEWMSKEIGFKGLAHQDRLGEWDPETNFWTNSELLQRVQGVISKVSGPAAGEIELAGGLKAFFVPGVADRSFDRSENTSVTFFVGFSYDGIRAWSVK